MEGIRAAVHAGADAIYAGGRVFGARAYAENPETEQLLEAIDYCHLHGVKIYLTVNTLLKENELTEVLPDYLAPIREHGVDAVLVQDFGVFHFLRQRFPDLPLHASTQMTITGPDGVRLLKEMGAERVVLSRELSMDEIQEIHRQCDVELETFVHGALCYCYSGQCLMSSLLGGRSGNRGRCAQPCRLTYDFYDSRSNARAKRMLNHKDEQHLLSLKDICTLHLIPELMEAGISSLKIEGRMKSPEYAAGVTAMYRKYIDLYLEKGNEGFFVQPRDEQMLTELFSRGDYSDGYYYERNGRDMIVLTDQSQEKRGSLRQSQETVARIREQYVETEYKIPLRCSVCVHEGVPAQMTLKDDRGYSFTAEGFVPTAAKSRPADRGMVLKQINKTGNTDFEFSSIDIDLQDGLFVQVRDLNDLRRRALAGIREEILKPYRRPAAGKEEGTCVDEEGPFTDEKSGPDGSGELSNSSGLGASGISAESGKLSNSSGPGSSEELSSPGASNALEKEIASSKAVNQTEESTRKTGNLFSGLYMGGYARITHPSVTAGVCTQAQLEEVLRHRMIGGVYLDHVLCTEQNARMVWDSGRKVYLTLPPIWRIDTAKKIRKQMEEAFGSFGPVMKASVDGILVQSFDQLYALKTAELLNDNDGFEVIADAGMYTWNKHARQQLRELGVTMDTLPYECSAKEMQERGCENSECVIYGYQTLMVSAQCLVKTVPGCSHVPSIHFLKDRKGVLFPVRNDCSICTNTIYNSVPLDLVSLAGQVKAMAPASTRYLFTVESAEETRKILKGDLPDEMTRGHFRKGAE